MIEKACEGLVYTSETDAPVTAFMAAVFIGKPGAEGFLEQIDDEPGDLVQEIDFIKFFERLTAVNDWHGERERLRAKQFLDLQKLIEDNLSDLKVYKVGDVRIQIYAVGIDNEGRLMGIRTSAVET